MVLGRLIAIKTSGQVRDPDKRGGGTKWWQCHSLTNMFWMQNKSLLMGGLWSTQYKGEVLWRLWSEKSEERRCHQPR